MKTVKALLILIIFSFLPNANAQKARVTNDTEVETKHSVSYYEQRGLEDALYEQQFEAKSKTEERAFWEEQKKYEKELKKNDRRAHRAYLQGKKEGYAAHHDHCDNHCHHSDYWYQYAGHYYYGYSEPRYENRSNRTRVNTQIGVTTPKVRLGIF
ncbi:hypothetical protein [Flavobacterium sp. Arc2]|uniref:hypothetical protein n=1 Tax=Flavobacterium sp. Arc2 TaxID=3046685 RepID=UPI00352C02C6